MAVQGGPSDYDRSSSGCVAAGYYWYNGDCHSSAPSAGNINNSGRLLGESLLLAGQTTTATAAQGSPSDYDRTNNGSCQLAGYYWYGD